MRKEVGEEAAAAAGSDGDGRALLFVKFSLPLSFSLLSLFFHTSIPTLTLEYLRTRKKTHALNIRNQI
jgi:hypothetical protein